MRPSKLLALAFASIVIISCSKKKDPKPNDPPPPSKPSEDILSNFNITEKHIGETSFLIPQPTSSSQGAFTYTSDNPAVATIKGDSIVILSLGTANITAMQAASGKFLEGSISTVLNVTANVYITGYSSSSGGRIAEYWKNGNMVKLNGFGLTSNIIIQGNDIYIAGNIDTLNGHYPGYWKNGKPVLVSPTEGSIAGMAIVGNDIYVAGYIQNNDAEHTILATAWKNGNRLSLQDRETKANKIKNSSEILGLTVVNDKVYFCGASYMTSTGSLATVWKPDGASVQLTDIVPGESSPGYSIATSINFSNGDMYVSGLIGSENVYWKNSAPVIVSHAAVNFPNSYISINNANVYVAGVYSSGNANNTALWKNGATTSITQSAEATGLYIADNNIYVIGNNLSATGISTPFYWLNGNMINFPSPDNTRITGIMVVGE